MTEPPSSPQDQIKELERKVRDIRIQRDFYKTQCLRLMYELTREYKKHPRPWMAEPPDDWFTRDSVADAD